MDKIDQDVVGVVDDKVSTALVEVVPGTLMVFGQVPDGLDVVPLSLIPRTDLQTLESVVATAAGLVNVGAQVVNGLAQAQGLVRLAPETLRALSSGATTLQSGGWNIGTLAQAGKFSASVKWLPAAGASAGGVVAAVGPALALMAIQMQLNEITGLVHENLQLTESVLKVVRNEQWAELTGLEGAVSKAVSEANSVGHVTNTIWENVSGSEAELGKQRDLFQRSVKGHLDSLQECRTARDRRTFLETNSVAIMLDCHCLMLANKAWFQYQALRAARACDAAVQDDREVGLAEKIVADARAEYGQVVGEVNTLIDALRREMWILAQLPGRRTIPFTKSRRSADEVARMADSLFEALSGMTGKLADDSALIPQPAVVSMASKKDADMALRILRWRLNGTETVGALVAARERGAGDVVAALTDERVLIADQKKLFSEGIVRQMIPTSDIRYVRHRPEHGSVGARIDLITKDADLTLTFPKEDEGTQAVRAVGAMLAEHMNLPDTERIALLADLPALPVSDDLAGDEMAGGDGCDYSGHHR